MSKQKKNFSHCAGLCHQTSFPSDTLKTVQEKMQEYLENGAQFGWLIDPSGRRVYVYRPGVALECFDNPRHLWRPRVA